jgi:hypothetical protein
MHRISLGLLLLSACGTKEAADAPAPAGAETPAEPAPAEPKPAPEPESPPPDDGPGVEVGDIAPPFSLPDDTGKEISLDQYRDQRAVLLAFYPKDFTGG